MAGTDELQRRLERLAEQAPSPGAAPGVDDAAVLWDRGCRAHRRQAAGVTGAVLVVLVLVALAAGLPVRLDTGPQPAAPSGGMALPDRFWVPSPWQARATREPGRLVALTASEDRGVVGADRAAVAGVDAAGGYHLLDLPGWVGAPPAPAAGGSSAGAVAISADGTRVAYWSSGGEASGRLNTSEGSAATAVSVLETTTGRVRTHAVPSEHGLRATGLRWVDDDLWFDWGYFSRGGRDGDAEGADVAVWDPGTDPGGSSVERLAGTGYVGGLGVTSAWRGWVVRGTSDRVTLLSRDADRRPVILDRFVTDVLGDAPVHLADDGRVAGLEDRDGPTVGGDRPLPLVVSGRGLTDARERVRLRRVGDVRALSVLGWRDEHHVVVYQGDDGAVMSVDEPQPIASLVSVDVRDGSTEELSRVPGATRAGVLDALGSHAIGLAADALAAPVLADAAEPPQPWDPRLRLALAGAAVLVLVGLTRHLLRRRRGLA